MTPTWEVIEGDCIEVMAAMDPESVQCCVTSPPYWGLRDYDCDGQLGLEETPGEYVKKMVDVFRGVWRVLRNDGTLWLNLGDLYSGNGPGIKNPDKWVEEKTKDLRPSRSSKSQCELPRKNLMMIPARVAIALQDDGWYIRQEIIWNKPNPMPEGVNDRPTRSHEQIYLLTKAPKYYYNLAAIKERSITQDPRRPYAPGQVDKRGTGHDRGGGDLRSGVDFTFRNKRSVWTVSTAHLKEAHFATFPPKLIIPCIDAGSKPGDTIFDPFTGSGTTGIVSLDRGRSFIGAELNPQYCEMSRRRISESTRQGRLF